MNIEKTVYALKYLSLGAKNGGVSYLTQLMYLADRSHAIKYGCSITGTSSYVAAMEPCHGRNYKVPQCVQLKDLFSLCNQVMEETDSRSVISGFITRAFDVSSVYHVHCTKAPIDIRVFSPNELSTLDEVVSGFGIMTVDELYGYTSSLPEVLKFNPYIDIGSVLDGDTMEIYECREVLKRYSASKELPIS